MAIVKVQQATGSGATIALTGVAAGNLLVILATYYRASGSQATLTAPTDSNGTVQTASNDTPSNQSAVGDIGCAIFYVANTASGTHTITPAAGTDAWNFTVVEYSGCATSSPFDLATSAKTNNGTQLSQVTGTTAATAQASELIIAGLAVGGSIGTATLGLTDPVSGFTTLHKVDNDLTDLGTMHIWKSVSSTGTQSTTFNWSANGASDSVASHAAIATFKDADAGGGGAITVDESDWQILEPQTNPLTVSFWG